MVQGGREELLRDLAITSRGDGTTGESQIDDRIVRGACRWVDDSGVLDLIARWRAEDTRQRHPGGAPAKYAEARDRIILVLMVLLLLEDRPPQMVEMQRAVRGRLSPAARRMIGLPETDRSSDQALYSRIRRAWDRLTDTFDMAPGRLGKSRPTRAEVDAVKAARDPEACARNAERGRIVLDTLLEASVRLLPEEHLRKWRGSITIDATVAKARGRGHRTVKPIGPDDSMNSDIDAEYHHNHDGSLTHGFDVHIALMGQNDPREVPQHPILAIAATVDQPSRRVGANAVYLAQSIKNRGYPTYLCTTDRGYYGNCNAEDFHLPMMALGYGLVGEPKHRQGKTQPIQFTHKGANYIDGAWYSPAMPDDLVWARIHYADGLIDEDTFRSRCEARRDWLFRAKDGRAFMCPAQGPGATVTCEHRNFWEPKHLRRDRSKRPTVRQAPDQPMPVCLNSTSTSFPVDDPRVAKFAQALHYGSPEHRDTYRLHRSTIEAFNAYSKDDNHQALGATRNRRRRGMVNHVLVIAATLAVTNMRKIRAFLTKQEDGAQPTNPTPEKRSKRDPFADHLPPEQWPPGESPGCPTAA